MKNIKLYKKINSKNVIPVILIIIGWLIVYSHVVSYPLINWDDQYYIINNIDLRGSWIDIIHNAFTKLYQGNYFPLHILSYAIEWKFFGDNPFIYHLDNILLHLFNSLLVFALFFKLCKNRKIAFITAFLFTVHPVHVESVVWVSERKDTLYLFFFLLAFLYERFFADKNNKKYLILSYFFYVCSLLSKSTAVVFPVILFFSQYCFDKNFSFKKNIIKIMPYAVLALIFSFVQVIGQNPPLYESSGIIKAVELFMRYINNVIYPVNLSPRYEIHNDIPLFFIFLFLFVTVYLCIKNRLILWCVLWLLCALLPVLNLIPNQIIMADRYLYLAAIPIYAIFGFFIDYIIKTGSFFYKKICLTAVLCIVLLLMLLTLNQTLAWNSTESMWKRVMKVQPDDYNPILRLGLTIYDRTYDINSALKYLEMAKQKFPDEPEIYYQIGSVYYDNGIHNKAKYYLNYALSIPSTHFKYTDAFLKLMHIYALEGDFKNELMLFNNPDFQNYGKEIVEDIKKKIFLRYDLITGTHRMLLNNEANTQIIYENILHLLNEGYLRTAYELIILAERKYPDNKDFRFLKGFFYVLSNNISKAKQIYKIENFEDDFMKYKYCQVILTADKNIMEESIKMFPNKKMFLLEYSVFIMEQNKDNWIRAQDLMTDILRKNLGWRFAPRFLYLKKLVMDTKRQRGYFCNSVGIHKTKPDTDDGVF